MEFPFVSDCLCFNIDFHPVGVQLQSHRYARIEPCVFGFIEKILFTGFDLRLSLFAAAEGICIGISKYVYLIEQLHVRGITVNEMSKRFLYFIRQIQISNLISSIILTLNISIVYVKRIHN